MERLARALLLFFIIEWLSACTNVNPTVTLSTSSSNSINSNFVLQYPSSPISNVTQPQFKIKKTEISDVVKIYTDSTCTNLLQEAPSLNGGELTISIQTPMTDGTYPVFYKTENPTTQKKTGCLDPKITYQVDTIPPTIAAVFVGEFGRGQTGFGSPAPVRWVNTSDTGSGVAKYKISIGTTMLSTDIMGWTAYGTYSELLSTGLNLNYGAIDYFTNFIAIDKAGNESSPAASPAWRSAWKTATFSLKPTDDVLALAEDTSNRLIIGGKFQYLSSDLAKHGVILKSNGEINTTLKLKNGFGGGGVNKAQTQPDGKIVVAGSFNRYQGIAAQGLVRLNADGSRDETFNQTGTGLNAAVLDFKIQTDGKLIVVGVFSQYNGANVYRMIRLNADGTQDGSFSLTGTGFPNNVNCVEIDSNGKYIVGGAFTQFNGSSQAYIARIDTNGTLDSSFNIGTGFNNVVNAIKIRPDGKIYVGGNFTQYKGLTQQYLALLNPDGSIDSSIGTTFVSTAQVFSMELQPDNKLLIGGNFTTVGGFGRNYIARIQSDGSLDTGFTPPGAGFGGGGSGVTSLLYDNGRILAGGMFTSYNSISYSRIIALNATDASVDTSFNTGQGIQTSGGGVNTILKLSSNNYFLGGTFDAYDSRKVGGIARYNIDHSLDESFNPGGSGFNGDVNCLAIQSDGKILVGGAFTQYNGSSANYIARLNSDGSLDSSFAPTGSGLNGQVNSIAIRTDSDIMVGGNFLQYNGSSQNRIARLNPDGTLDMGFAIGTGFASTVNVLVVDASNNVYVGGAFTQYNGTTRNYLAKVGPAGTIDSTFNTSFFLNGQVNSIQLNGGNIIAGGAFTNYNGTARNRFIVLNNSTAVLDGFTSSTLSAGTNITKVLVTSDSNYLLAGNFDTYAAITSSKVVKINSSSTVKIDLFESGIATLQGTSSAVKSALQLSNGNIVLGSGILYMNDQGDSYLTELSP